LRIVNFFIGCFVATCLLLSACSPTKDKWLNRKWHTMTGRFNVYFNGEVKLLETLESLEKGHQDDFTKLLEVFPYGDEAASKGVAGQLDIVLKKVSLAIQNHYVGSYTDNSYYLMGKAHYYKRDYYAGMEAFQFVNSKFKDKGLKPVCTAWIAKCYAGLGKIDEAEAVIGLLLSEEQSKLKKQSIYHKIFPETPKEYSQEIYATAADIAIKQRKFVSATEKLTIALSYATQKQVKIRYTYILAQLYTEMDSIKIANQYYSKILNMLAPYEFEFNASINLAKAYDLNDKSAAKQIRRSLKRMLKDDKNDGYYDQIWYELGNLEMKEKNVQQAIYDYKKCSEVQGKNPNQKALAYLALGTIYLDLPNYKLAQAYYDSTASSINATYKDYQKIIIKKTVLSDLINNLIVIETEDSLQELAKLNEVEIDQKINQWITQAKVDSLANVKKSKDKKEAARLAQLNPEIKLANTTNAGFGQQGQWYFYNPTIMASGAAEFFSQKKWGMRTNEDFWRIAAIEKQETILPNESGEKSNTEANNAIKTESTQTENASTDTTKDLDFIPAISGSRKSWIENVPYTKDQLKRSNNRLLDAYYNLGIIYDEKLDDSKEAIKDFELLLYRFPSSEYEPQVLYKLYKLYITIDNNEQASIKKNRLIAEYPESPYALIIQNKTVNTAETDANIAVVDAYEYIYELYSTGNFEEVKIKKQEADKKFAGNTLQAKFDLVYALAVGKTESIDHFKLHLNELVVRYPKTDVGDRAQAILNYLSKLDEKIIPDSLKPKEPDFVITPEGPFYMVVAIYDDKLDMNEFLSKMNAYHEEFNEFDNLRVNPMLSNEGFQLLMVREFRELDKAMSYYSDFKTRDVTKKRLKYEGTSLTFVISQAHFKKMLKEKKVELYQQLFSEYENSKLKK
jgi:tetratricopeptide (TPR) repeat protein